MSDQDQRDSAWLFIHSSINSFIQLTLSTCDVLDFGVRENKPTVSLPLRSSVVQEKIDIKYIV